MKCQRLIFNNFQNDGKNTGSKLELPITETFMNRLWGNIAPKTQKIQSPKILFLGPAFIRSIILMFESGYG